MQENNNLAWDLEAILGYETLEELKDKYFSKQQELVKLYSEGIFEKKEDLIKFHSLELEYEILSNRLHNYLSNKHNENLGDNTWFALMQEIQIKSIPFNQAFSDFSEKVIKKKSRIKKWLESEDFQEHKRTYEKIFRSERHILPPIIKKFAATYSPLSNSFDSIFTLLLDKELPVREANDSKKIKHPINNYALFLKTQTNPDRTLRKNAFINWYGAINKMRETFAKIMYYHILKQNINAKNAKFPKGFVSQSCFEDEIKEKFVTDLYREIRKFKELVMKYREIRKEILKKSYDLDIPRAWDLRMPIIKKDDSHVSIEEAKSITLQSLEILGPEYVKNIKKALEERWIDWEARQNKLSGAYCIGGCYGLEKKYILLNYNYKLDDVYTLVHELGHAMHAIEFCKHQTHYASTSIFIAEIPSTLNEILLSFYLLEKYRDNPQKKLEIYDDLISNFFATTVNQIIFSEWEYEVNNSVNNGVVLDADYAENTYRSKQKKYAKERKEKILNPIKNKALTAILTVPHFYSGEFYVYKYAVGQIVSLLIALKIRENKKYIDSYYKFLRSGSSLSNLDTIKLLGLDLSDQNVWLDIKETIEGWIQEYERLSIELKLNDKSNY